MSDRNHIRSTARDAVDVSPEKQRSGKTTSANLRKRYKRKNQVPAGIAVLVAILAIAYFLGQRSPLLAFFWLSGIAFGFILQRARFCFTASLRDPMLTGMTSLTRAALVAFAITTVGFAAIKYGFFLRGLPLPGQGYVVPISFATVAGGFLFGIGMVIAGGCASGTFMRVGEGFTMQMITLVFFIIGSLWGARDFGWWMETFIARGTAVFLPDYLGWFGAVTLQLIVIAILFIVADRWEEKKTGR